MSANTVAYQCPCCGAGLGFDPEQNKFACEFCLSTFDEAELSVSGAAEAAQKQATDGEAHCEQMNLFNCPNCGAEVVADDNTVADFCYYCHNPVVHAGRLSGQMQPNRVIPFKLNKQEAEDVFMKWCKAKWFLPKAFKSRAHAEQIRGVYYPFWVTDADAVGSTEFDATRVRTWHAGDYKYTETQVYEIERAGDIHFEDIVTCALSDADKKMLEGVLPYPSDELTEFSMPYLSGYLAKKRDIERDTLSDEVRGRMQEYTTELLRRTVTVPYSTLTPKGTTVKIKESHWEYALIPIWILTYTHKNGKVYTFAVNGSTGKIYGELPVSIPRLAALFAAVALPATAILSWIGGVLF